MRAFKFTAAALLAAAPLAAQNSFADQEATAAEEQAAVMSRMRMDVARSGVLAQAARVRVERHGRNDSDYRRGKGALDKRDWQSAVDLFQHVIEEKGSDIEGALYWKAYALNKLGRRADASATLAELGKSYPNSGWINDAKALEVEVKQASGQGPSPENESDEDLKLLAINSLMHSDPDRALPLLEKQLKGPNSPRLKERALFVLAQSRSPRANEILLQTAKGAGNPELQMKAIEYLGAMGNGSKENGQLLASVYQSSKDKSVRAAVLRSYMMSQDKARLLEAAKGESDPDLRREAIQYLGAVRAEPELAQLYQTEQDPEVRAAVLRGFMMGSDGSKLIEIAKTEKDANLRAQAIRYLGTMRGANTSEALLGMYQSDQSPEVKKQIITALFIQQNAKALVDIARKENDPALKRSVVEKLSMMKSKEGTDYLMELLNK